MPIEHDEIHEDAAVFVQIKTINKQMFKQYCRAIQRKTVRYQRRN